MGWECTVNTGNPEADRMTIDQYRRAAEGQGMALQVQPLPTGGFHVRAAPQGQGGYAAAAGYGAPQGGQAAAQGGYGAAQGGYGAAQGGYGAAQGGYGAAPAGHGAQPAVAAFNPSAGYAAPQGNYGVPAQQQAQQASYAAAQAQQPYGAQPSGAQAYGQPAQGFGGASGGPAWGQPAYAGMPAAGASGGGAVAAVSNAIADLGKQRIQHLRKVYGLLAVSAVLAITCGFICITVGEAVRVPIEGGRFVKVPPIVAALLFNPGLLYGAFGLLFVSTLGASFVSKVKYLNMVALLFVSALMGLELAPMVFYAQLMAGLGNTISANPVRDSFLLVGAIFIGISIYSLVSRKDFSYLGATLTMGFFVIFTACIIAAVIGSEIFSLAVASAGALLAAGFLLYNTSLILKGDMDDPVGDALGLLVQLRNLFMFILRILMSRR